MRRTFQRLATADSQSNNRLKKPAKLIRAVIAKREMYASDSAAMEANVLLAAGRFPPEKCRGTLCQAALDSEVVQHIGIFFDGVPNKNNCF